MPLVSGLVEWLSACMHHEEQHSTREDVYRRALIGLGKPNNFRGDIDRRSTLRSEDVTFEDFH